MIWVYTDFSDKSGFVILEAYQPGLFGLLRAVRVFFLQELSFCLVTFAKPDGRPGSAGEWMVWEVRVGGW